jgi:hypothetical protein
MRRYYNKLQTESKENSDRLLLIMMKGGTSTFKKGFQAAVGGIAHYNARIVFSPVDFKDEDQ